MTSAELRSRFLVSGLFEPGRLHLAATDLDRLVIAGAMPDGALALPPDFLERRELGILNLGGRGTVTIGGEQYALDRLDCLYAGMGAGEVRFEGDSGRPQFYLAACPAHRRCPTAKLSAADARVIPLGDGVHASCREIHQYICPGMLESCQLVMGFTELAPGNVWNTMPAHTHRRRSEIYLYFDLEGAVVHLMGEPERTRHLMVHSGDAVLSPPWSIHAGAGTSHYRFAWAMAGENQDFGDVDPLSIEALR